MIDFKQSVEAIANIEGTVDVNAVRLFETRLWPLVRMLLWYQLMNPRQNHTRLDGDGHTYRYILTPSSQTAVLERAQAGPTDLLLFSSSAYYTDKAGDAVYNRHVDPLSDLFGDTFAIQNMELADARSAAAQPRRYPGLALDVAVEQRPVAPGRTRSLPGFEDLRRSISRYTGLEVDQKLVLDQFSRLRAYRTLFNQVLAQLAPRAVGIICYYHLPGMALAWACRSRGLPCLEIQHGKQGKYHGMYTHWTATPPEGYELLPSHFWTWGEESRENIAKWLPPECVTPKVEALGSPWLSLWLDGPGCPPEGDLLERLTAKTAGRQGILFSMQPLEEPLPVSLLQAIRHSPPDWLWLLRLHPRDLDQCESWAAFFARNGMDNVECRLANEAPLFTLLKHARHHVTCYSSVAFEALSFGLSTTLIGPTGRSLYRDYIRFGHFRQADTTEEILQSVRAGLTASPHEEVRPYILHNPQRMSAFLRQLTGPADSVPS